jgi:hypothetical protein
VRFVVACLAFAIAFETPIALLDIAQQVSSALSFVEAAQHAPPSPRQAYQRQASARGSASLAHSHSRVTALARTPRHEVAHEPPVRATHLDGRYLYLAHRALLC